MREPGDKHHHVKQAMCDLNNNQIREISGKDKLTVKGGLPHVIKNAFDNQDLYSLKNYLIRFPFKRLDT